MNARKHAWNDGAAANVRGAVVERGSFAIFFSETLWNSKYHFEVFKKKLVQKSVVWFVPFYGSEIKLGFTKESNRR